jgi:DNA invertase Pin-like site-specific DNA recombinase/transposase-like protein
MTSRHPAPAWRKDQTPWERYRETGSLAGMRIGVGLRVSRKATKTELEIARRGTRDFDKSTDDQEDDASAWAARPENEGVILVFYADVGISGGRGSRAKRKMFRQMLRDAEDGHLDGLRFFDLDRSGRDMGVTVELANLAEDEGVLIIEGGHVLDPDDDRLTMMVKGAVSEEQLRKIKRAAKRGRDFNRAQGYPGGPVGYGWVREKHPGTEHLQLYQSLKVQRPDGLLPGIELLPGGHGLGPRDTPLSPGQVPAAHQLARDTPAWIVLEMFTRYSEGWYDEKIAADLNARGIGVSAGSGKWRGSRVREILIDARYAGYQTHKGTIVRTDPADSSSPPVYGRWVPLVSTELYWACHNRRAAKRAKYRDARQQDGRYATGGGPYMMAATARCGKCGETMSPWADYVKPEDRPEDYEPRIHYTCTAVGCWGTSIGRIELDNLVDEVMVRCLSDETVTARLREARDAEAEGVVAQARAEIGECQTEIAGLPAKVEAGDIDPVFATARQRGLEKQITDARLRASLAGVPLILVPLLAVADDAVTAAEKAGLGAEQRQAAIRKAVTRAWTELPPLERRAIIRVCAVIHVRPAGRGRNNQYARKDSTGARVHWQWLIGPDAGDGEYVLPERTPRNRSQVTVTIDGEIVAQGSYTTAEKGELAAALMAEHGWNGTQCAAAMGVQRSSVYYWLRKAAEEAGRAYQPPPQAPPRRPGKVLTITIDGEVVASGEYTTAEKGRLAAALMAGYGLNISQCARAMGVTAPGVSYWLRAAAIDAAGAAVTAAS